MNKKWVIFGILVLLGVTLSGCIGVVGYDHGGHGYGYYSYPDRYHHYEYPDRFRHRDWEDHHRNW